MATPNLSKFFTGKPGPTDTSYWVCDSQDTGLFVAGAYPGDKDDEKKHQSIFEAIVQQDITTFISLIHTD